MHSHIPIINIQRAIINSPEESLVDQKWFIALLSSLLGVVISACVAQFIEYLKEKNKRRKILHGLLREIQFLVNYYTQQLSELEETLSDIRSGKRIMLVHPQLAFGESYNIYLNNLIFLELKLDEELYLFFKYFVMIDAASVKFDDISEKYKNDSSYVKPNSLMLMLGDILDKTKKAKTLGESLEKKIIKYL